MSANAHTRLRIFMTGVGGQGTLTATTLLARAALAAGLQVTSGEIHGMAQRGGVVESTLLIGYMSPKIGHGEADILLGFEPLETLRALPYLKPGGLVLSSTESLPPLSVATGKETAPGVDEIRATVTARCASACFMPCRSLGLQAGAVQSGNIALLGALCALNVLPFGQEAIEMAIRSSMKPKVAEINLKALGLGAACAA
ncbi:indolepyruvate ferredoxin oxidoreductase beta subunit [Humidesulfovibrio mexicanus]|uniref:Indolepyruvate ferredoxin oxidoreductase beta subunit n=1 Tax=Humidesulfovibrio mexicanus TaxID=147047 RepID=A0A239AZR8_9BACT|nr:2-oxoacid:acceptor oxidoreductase family protein [Humidesulfovibrio mexicanus]SNS00871.1 indolepyruvate ferredoxin oxidoreductase beta subunit [Humidesulfovibrio mexicanus]